MLSFRKEKFANNCIFNIFPPQNLKAQGYSVSTSIRAPRGECAILKTQNHYVFHYGCSGPASFANGLLMEVNTECYMVSLLPRSFTLIDVLNYYDKSTATSYKKPTIITVVRAAKKLVSPYFKERVP